MQGIRNPARLKVLTEEQVDAIHEASLRLLERTGARFDHERARKRLVDQGAIPHPSRKNVLTFPRSVVEEAVRKIPRFGTYYARDPRNDVTFDGEHTFSHALGGNPATLDLETGVMRSSTLRDVEEASRMQDALEHCHTAGPLVVATDVPAPVHVLKTMQAMLENTSKCVSGYALRTAEVEILLKMGAAVAGSEEAFRKRPIFTLYGSPSSPLTYDEHVCEVILLSASNGVPVDIVPCPIAGGTAPLSLAGGLAQQNAELLAGVMLLQTVDPDIPTQYSGRLSFLDLRSGKNLWGLPELGLVSAATVQIAHRYHMTADVYGVTTDANGWDLQMGLERMVAALPPALAGADNLSGIGGAWENAGSLAMMVLDDETYADVFRLIQGIEVDDDRLALDVIEQVGPMGNFLAQRHTMKYLRAGEMRNSPLWDKRTMDRARAEGIRPIQEAARERAGQILREHVPTPLDPDVRRDLARIVDEGSRALLRTA